MESRAARAPSERSVPDHFASFELSILRIGEAYRARVVDSPVGPRPPVTLDPAGLHVERHAPAGSAEPTRDLRRHPVDREDLRLVGERLFGTVFTGNVIEAFRASVERTRSDGGGLRICLQLDEAPELAALPWEALWDPKDRAFFADQSDLPIVRALRIAAEAPVMRAATPPLRLLGLLPEPRGENKLGGTSEWQRIQEHLAPLVEADLVQAEQIEPPTLHELGKRISQGPCHVLHIVAHGGQGEPGAGGQLHLEDAAGGLDAVTGGDLARALERRASPRLVILNACHGARAAVDDAFDGMAQHLLSRGVPAVVAMRTAISDAAAISFSAALYQELAKGRTIEAAVVESRRVLSLGEHRAEWATPALYLRGANVRIFEAGLVGTPVLASRSGGPRRLTIAAGAAVAGAVGLLTMLAWSAMKPSRVGPVVAVDSDLCPSPLKLQDLEFVRIEPDVVKLADRHLTVKDAFCMSTKEVSRRDWFEVMNVALPRPDWPGSWPMTDVTIESVRAFMEQLEARDPRVIFRLPTADEWEFAARAGASTDYFFGDDPANLDQYGNCNNFLGRDGADGPAPVDAYLPNPWGLHNVHGNVAEWVQWPAAAGPAQDETGRELALRLGGSFDNAPSNCTFVGSRSEVRADIDDRVDTGFRVVRELEVP